MYYTLSLRIGLRYYLKFSQRLPPVLAYKNMGKIIKVSFIPQID